MLGFDAGGRLALGQVPSGTIQQAITGIIRGSASLRTSLVSLSALAGKSTGAARARVSMSPTSAISAKAKAMAQLKVPGGVALKSIVHAQSTLKVSPGYLLFAKAMMASSAIALPHLEGTTSGPRDPLLLNSASEFTASYWKGRS